MSTAELELFYHPLASYCWKALIGLYESKLEFTGRIVDLGNPDQRAELAAMWPFVKFPVLREAGEVRAESSIMLEHLALTKASARWLLPMDPMRALETRAMDRFFDTYLHGPMQQIVADRLRTPETKDPTGVASARATLATAYAHLDRLLEGREWADGGAFSLADCAAYPALYYGNRVAPISESRVVAYLARLTARPSIARVMKEAEPYLAMFPG